MNNHLSRLEPFVSIVIPAFNSEDTIGHTISSLLDQSYPANNFEIIVVNDGSTDRTVQVVQQIQAEIAGAVAENSFPQVRFFFQANQGPAAARNLGALQANGTLLLFTDSDCVPDHYWVEQMVQPLASSDAEGVMGKYETRQSGIVARLVQLEFEQRYDRLQRYRYIDVAFTYTAGFRRDLFLELGGFEASLFTTANNEDTDFSYRFAQAGHRIVFNPKAVVYHKQTDTLLEYLKEKFWRAQWRMLVYRRHPRKILNDTYTSHSLKVQIALFYLMLASLGGVLWFRMNFVGYTALALLVLFGLVSLPAIWFNSTYNVGLGLLTPFFLWLRAVAMGLGVITGVIASWKLSASVGSSEQADLEKQNLLP